MNEDPDYKLYRRLVISFKHSLGQTMSIDYPSRRLAEEARVELIKTRMLNVDLVKVSE